jgi:Tfp pilus assembly protein PilX
VANATFLPLCGSSGRRGFVRGIGLAVVVLLLLNGGAWYQLAVRSQRPPAFDRGGAFAAAEADADVETSTTTTSTTAPTTSSAAPVVTAPPTTAAVSPGNAYAPGRVTAVSTGQPATPGVLPALGTYRWKVTGTEGATGFGSRSFPSTATVVAHADGRNVVLDTNYSSDHQERLIVSDQGGALAAVYEAGQVRFGPMAQTNSGSYTPPMVYVPAELRAGAVTKGTSSSTDPNGKVQRVEDWTVAVEKQVVLPVMGTPTNVWQIVLERRSRPGGSQEVQRTRRIWWDPNRHFIVRYTDTMHGQQSYGVTFTYDSDLTAELVGFTPAR